MFSQTVSLHHRHRIGQGAPRQSVGAPASVLVDVHMPIAELAAVISVD